MILFNSSAGLTPAVQSTYCEIGNNTWNEAASAKIDDVPLYRTRTGITLCHH